LISLRYWIWAAAGGAMATCCYAQQQPIASVSTEDVSLSGSLSVAGGRASIGNNGAITAGDRTAVVDLSRGGELRVCASTKVRLSKDTSVEGHQDFALMMALDRGALEASYQPGKYSDVLLTPDLRILISGPGQADLKIRVNQQGDTCVDNHGANAPYVTVTSQFTGGVYRVQANQRVLFEHGSLDQVVDNESEPCGCPVPEPVSEPVSVAADAPGVVTDKAQPGQPVTEHANPFPLAESEGLKSPPSGPTQPVVPVGTPHAEVQAPIGYDAAATPNPAAPGAAGAGPSACRSTASPGCPNLSIQSPASPPTESQPVTAQIPPVSAPQKHQGGFFHSIGHFFSKIFGG
jgi:hypothetical protein